MYFGIDIELASRAAPSRHDAPTADKTNTSNQVDFGTSLLNEKAMREGSPPEQVEKAVPDTASATDALMVALPAAFDSKIVTPASQEFRPPQQISSKAGIDPKIDQSRPNLGEDSGSDVPLPAGFDRTLAVSPSIPEQAHGSTSVTTGPSADAHRRQQPLGAVDANTILTLAPSLSAAHRSAQSLTLKPAQDARFTSVVDDPSRAVERAVDEVDAPRLDGSKLVNPVEGLDLLERSTTVSDVSKIMQGEGATGRQGMTESASSPIQFASLGVSAPSPTLATPPSTMTPTLGLVTATPTEVVDIISDKLAGPEDRRDRVTVQLNPVELGRVSVDFKFDAQGLTHVTITGETPEALRQLRALHFELVNALERQGLAGQNMTFQQEQRDPQGPSTDLKPIGSMRATEPESRADAEPKHVNIANGSSLNIKV